MDEETKEILEALLMQTHDNNHEDLLNTLILQGDKSNHEDLLDTLIQQSENHLTELKEIKEKLCEEKEYGMEDTNELLGKILSSLQEEQNITVSLNLV